MCLEKKKLPKQEHFLIFFFFLASYTDSQLLFLAIKKIICTVLVAV